MRAAEAPVTRWPLALAIVAAAGCSLEPFTLRFGGGAADAGPGAADAAADAGPRPDAAPPCVPVGPDDQCDEIDNDCNGIVDDAFDKQTDGNNCGVCGHRCASPGAIEQCVGGTCQFVECQPGFADLDPAAPGCEYLCPVFPPAPEDCNG
ncbi:MAG: hypothetical protein D6689_08715, partial [Deltaproteobacteria bacterium]